MSRRNTAIVNSTQLKRTLGFAGVLGQSIAGESPTATPALNIALVFAAGGGGTWLVFLISTLVILLVSLNIAPLARSGSAAGSLSDFVRRGLGELAVVSPRHFIPRNAMLAGVALVLATSISFAAFAKPMDIYDWFGTFATFGFVTAYLLTCVSMPLALARQGTLRPAYIAASIAAIVVLTYVLFIAVYPVPAPPLNILPWLFLGLLGIGSAWSLCALKQRPARRGEP